MGYQFVMDNKANLDNPVLQNHSQKTGKQYAIEKTANSEECQNLSIIIAQIRRQRSGNKYVIEKMSKEWHWGECTDKLVL